METNTETNRPTLTVLEKARELHILLSRVILDENILPKVYRFFIGKPVTDHSQIIYESLTVANTLDLYDKDLTEERKKYQITARRELTKLLAALRIMYSISEMDSEKMRALLDKTIEVERLLKKWMESDRHRVGVALNIVKKDIVDTKVFDREISTRDLFEPKSHVDFDLLIKDVRNQGTTTPIHHATGRPVYIPPAESLNTAPVPPPKYVVKSDEQRVEEVKKSRFDLGNADAGVDTPPPKIVPSPGDYVIKAKPVATREPVVITLRDKPIVVPDDRATPDPKPDPSTWATITSPDVEMAKGTPEMVTEDLPKEEKEEPCQKETAPSPATVTDPTATEAPTAASAPTDPKTTPTEPSDSTPPSSEPPSTPSQPSSV